MKIVKAVSSSDFCPSRASMKCNNASNPCAHIRHFNSEIMIIKPAKTISNDRLRSSRLIELGSQAWKQIDVHVIPMAINLNTYTFSFSSRATNSTSIQPSSQTRPDLDQERLNDAQLSKKLGM